MQRKRKDGHRSACIVSFRPLLRLRHLRPLRLLRTCLRTFRVRCVGWKPGINASGLAVSIGLVTFTLWFESHRASFARNLDRASC